MADENNNDPRELYAADRAEFDRLGDRVTRMVSTYLNAVPDEAAAPDIPSDVRDLLSSLPIPAQGMSSDEILDFMEEHILPWPQPTGHARSYGWVNSPPAPIAVATETVAQGDEFIARRL